MRVLLVGPDLESNLSLRYLASALRQGGHEPRIATFDGLQDLPSVVKQAHDAELIGLSMCFQVRALEFLALARALKSEAPKRPVIAGGHYASCAANELLEHHPELDLIVIHEGERAIVELADLGSQLLAHAGGVRGVAWRKQGLVERTATRPILEDLDLLPEPDRAGPARLVAGVPTAYLMGSRGCVNRCDYCCITTLHRQVPGRRFRQRAPEKVVAEMAGLYHRHGVRQFVFHDDNFLVPSFAHNEARIGAFERALAAQGVTDAKLVLKCSPRDAEPRILARLKRLGLIRIFMGIESGSQCGLDAIGRRQTVAEAERALTLCEELDVSSQYTLIIFHPEATPESMLEDLDFARRHPKHPMNYCRAEVYAGTPLEQRLLESGRAIGNYLGHVYRYTDPRVERIWALGSELFAGRCWGKDEILGLAIRLDHQLTVVSHFYDGKAVERLVRDWRAYQVELNLDTAGLFAELVELLRDPDVDDETVRRAVADLERREKASRAVLHERLCQFRAAVDECTRAALPKAFRPKAAPKRLLRPVARPRHAAAVAVALGLAGVGPAGAGTPAPVGAVKKKPEAGDAGVAPLPPAAPPFQRDHGVAEAPPPPLDPYRVDVGVAEAAPPPFDLPPPPPPPRRDAGVPKLKPPADPLVGPKPDDRYRFDHGVAEAAPPPYDRYRLDHGVAEAAPPPLAMLRWADLRVDTNKGAVVYLSGVGKVTGAVAASAPLGTGVLAFKVNGSTGDSLFSVRLFRVDAGEGDVMFKIVTDPKLSVTLDGKDLGTSPLVTKPQGLGRRQFVFKDAESGVTLKIVVSVVK